MSKGNTMSKSRTYTYDSSSGLLSSRTMPGGKMVQYTYDAFGSTSHPHAVTEVDNTDGSIGHNYQEVSYNSWGKISSAWSYDPNDFYYYSVEYGPGLQRVWTQLDKTYNIECSKYYWDDYEEKTTGSLTTRYWYINGPDGLIGIYIEEQTPSGTVSIPTVAATDHLGSIEGLFGNNNYYYYAAKYDEWGDRDVMLLYGLSHGFDRGYTGHEHIDGLGLINMNGRMYDPLLGRFLSPDPYVQAPTDPQNYNRYSYCLNNPLKYTDPSGEEFSWKSVLSYFLLSPIVPPGTVEAVISQSLGTASNAALAGVVWGCINGNNIWEEAMSKAKNSFRIDFGMFQMNEDLDPLISIPLFTSRFTWELRQTIDGNTISHIRNVLDLVSDVSYHKGTTLVNMSCSSNERWGLTLGPYINSQNLEADMSSDLMFRHEYGHTIQSAIWGPAYINFIGVPSLIGALFGNLEKHTLLYNNHDAEWYETNANILADYYCDIFDVNFSSDELKQQWDIKYPTKYSPTWFWFVFAPPHPVFTLFYKW